MLPSISSFLFLVMVVTSLVSTQRQARPGVAHYTSTGVREGGEQRVRQRVSLLRAARAYRRFGDSNKLQMPGQQPYKKAHKPSNSLNSQTQYRSFKKYAQKVKTTSRHPEAPDSTARSKATVGNTRKKYAGVKFPKLDLFPQMQKPSLSKIQVLKVNTTVTDTKLPKEHRGRNTELTLNAKALETEYSSNGRPRLNYPKHRPDIRPTPSMSSENPDHPVILSPSKNDDIIIPDLMPSISPDEDGFLTVTHTAFTRTKDLYEETLTSLSEVVAMTKLRSTIINNSEIRFAHSEHNHPSRGVTEFTFEEICPTQTLLPQASTPVPAYNVLTHTTRVTNTAQATLTDMQGEGEMGARLRDIMSHLLPTAPLAPSTSYSTITITKISTITSDVTSDITITLGGRPVKTEYVIPTTMVFTDLHISRSAIVL